MSNILSNITMQIILSVASLVTYLLLLRKFLKEHQIQIDSYKKKGEEELDNKFLNQKTMKTKEFLAYHKNIHELDEQIEKFNSRILYCKWLAVICIILLFLDALFDYIRKWIMGYPFQGIIQFGIVLSGIIFIAYLWDIILDKRTVKKA